MKNVLFAVLALTTIVSAQVSLTRINQLRRMLDVERVALRPSATVQETTCVASTNSRLSAYAGGTWSDWNANADWNGMQYVSGVDSVILDTAGPLVIWRLQSSRPDTGRVYLIVDGDTVYNGLPFTTLFDWTRPEFAASNLCYYQDWGYVNYVPIAAQSRVKLVVRKGWGAYLSAIYSRFPAGTYVEPFAATAPAEYADSLAAINARIVSGHSPLGSRAGSYEIDTTFSLPPSSAGDAASWGGKTIRDTAAVSAIRLQVLRPTLDTAQHRDSVRYRTLSIGVLERVDSIQTGWTTNTNLGGFFGVGPFYTPYITTTQGLTDTGGYYSYWYRPFQKQYQLILHNVGRDTLTVRLRMTVDSLRQPIANYLRHHSWWVRNNYPMSGSGSGRVKQWNLFRNKGTKANLGYFVGCQVTSVMVTYNRDQSNNYYNWSGEGDFQVYCNQDTFPQFWDLGREGWTGYGWDCSHTFARASSWLSTVETATRYGTTVYGRNMLQDAIRLWGDSSRGVIEKNLDGVYEHRSATIYYYTDSTRGGYGDSSIISMRDYLFATRRTYEPDDTPYVYAAKNTFALNDKYRIDSVPLSRFGRVFYFDDSAQFAANATQGFEFKLPFLSHRTIRIAYAKGPKLCKIRFLVGAPRSPMLSSISSYTYASDTVDCYNPTVIEDTLDLQVPLKAVPASYPYTVLGVQTVGWNSSCTDGVIETRNRWGINWFQLSTYTGVLTSWSSKTLPTLVFQARNKSRTKYPVTLYEAPWDSIPHRFTGSSISGATIIAKRFTTTDTTIVTWPADSLYKSAGTWWLKVGPSAWSSSKYFMWRIAGAEIDTTRWYLAEGR